ncbi:alkylmercury lyase [Microbacterium sp. CH12i]|uniref:organomercurial lyase MerB n=1 Tax=Microbacterium sp. CH12i TaxID=1479651 RepID=UPI000461C13F|nr:organomercurial lyase MerB [Microbacterium sp. CH12i]KDA06942.1 alkylmercury lyase [Microbacterium sp. CH12i]
MSDLSTQLPNRFDRPEETGLDPGLLVPLLRLLADGDPVTIEQLAVAAGRTPDQVRRGLAAAPDTEYDEQGRVVGQGLTLRPTPHRFTVSGEELYTWCALDTLIFPALLDRPARVESVSPVSGKTIHVVVDPAAGVTGVEPATAVVSLVNPEQITSIRSSFCNQVHYFASNDDAATWLAEHPGAETVPVAEAHRIGIELTTRLLDRAQAEISAADDCHRCC